MIEGDRVFCFDQFGAAHNFARDYLSGKGMYPQEGEVWVMDQTSMGWMLVSCVSRVMPSITGSVIDGSAADSLLSVLEALGVITDDATRVEGGAESVDWLSWMNVTP